MFIAGSPMISDCARWLTYYHFRESPMRLTLHSLAFNEASYAGMFELLQSKQKTNLLHTVLGPYSIRECGLGLAMHAISARMGKEYSMPWKSRFGMDKLGWTLTPQQHIALNVDLLDPQAHLTYRIVMGGINHNQPALHMVEIVPCLFPALSIGINPNDYYFNANEMEATIKWHRGMKLFATNSSVTMNKFMSIMRIAGYDMSCTASDKARTYNNWASNTNGHYLPNFFDGDFSYRYYSFDWRDIRQRNNWWIELPIVRDSITIKMSIDIVGFSLFNDGQRAYVLGPPVTEKQIESVVIDRTASTADVYYLPYVINKIDINLLYQDFPSLSTQTTLRAVAVLL